MKSIWVSIKYLRSQMDSTGKRRLFSNKIAFQLLWKGVRFDPNNRINTWNARVK